MQESRGAIFRQEFPACGQADIGSGIDKAEDGNGAQDFLAGKWFLFSQRRAGNGHQGIDGIYKTKTEPPKYVIDEAKYGSSQLGKLKDGTKQMSDPWIFGSNRLSNSVGDIEAAKIEKAFKQNRVDRVLSQIDEYGNVTTYRLNNEGKIIGPWP